MEDAEDLLDDVESCYSAESIQPQYEDHRTDIWGVVARGEFGVLRAYVEAGGSVAVRDGSYFNETLLHLCARASGDSAYRPEFVFLVNNGLSINSQDDNGNTPLHIAVELGLPSVVRLFLVLGADPFVRNVKGVAPGETDLEYGADIAEWLATEGNPSARMKLQEAWMAHVAAEEQRATLDDWIMCRACITEGNHPWLAYHVESRAVDVNASYPAFDGVSLLMYATAHSDLDAAVYLLEQGADVNQRCVEGCTALHFCAADSPAEETARLPVLLTLLDMGADPTVVGAPVKGSALSDGAGAIGTAAEYADAYGCTRTVDILLAAEEEWVDAAKCGRPYRPSFSLRYGSLALYDPTAADKFLGRPEDGGQWHRTARTPAPRVDPSGHNSELSRLRAGWSAARRSEGLARKIADQARAATRRPDVDPRDRDAPEPVPVSPMLRHTSLHPSGFAPPGFTSPAGPPVGAPALGSFADDALRASTFARTGGTGYPPGAAAYHVTDFGTASGYPPAATGYPPGQSPALPPRVDVVGALAAARATPSARRGGEGGLAGEVMAAGAPAESPMDSDGSQLGVSARRSIGLADLDTAHARSTAAQRALIEEVQRASARAAAHAEDPRLAADASGGAGEEAEADITRPGLVRSGDGGSARTLPGATPAGGWTEHVLRGKDFHDSLRRGSNVVDEDALGPGEDAGYMRPLDSPHRSPLNRHSGISPARATLVWPRAPTFAQTLVDGTYREEDEAALSRRRARRTVQPVAGADDRVSRRSRLPRGRQRRGERALPMLPSDLVLGKHVRVRGRCDGIVRYVGPTFFAKGLWVGIDLLQPLGRHDGRVYGCRYFRCLNNHGLFVRPSRVSYAQPLPSWRV